MSQTSTLDDVRVRRAVREDAPTMARQRVSMFRDMGETTKPREGPLADASLAFFRGALESGEYVAWLIVTADAKEDVVAGAGVLLGPMLPRPTQAGVVQGREALIVNVYTEPAWRRRGLAALLMRHILEFTRANGIHRVLLHASDDGRPLYESLGFVPTTEMRLVYPG